MSTNKTDILVIGGGAAGTHAAETYRLGGGKGSVLIVSDETHPLYSRVLLPHATKGKVPPEDVFLKKTEFYVEKDIEFLPGRSVVMFDARARTAVLDDGSEITFDRAVIAVGGKPRHWNIPGAEKEGVLRLQTYEDVGRIRSRLKEGSTLAIIGSGFIALEFAAIAAAAKVKAALFNRGERFWASTLGPMASAVVESAVFASGVEVRNCAEAVQVIGGDDMNGLRFADDSILRCENAGIGIGMDIPVGPFKGLRTAEGILTDATLETSEKGVWAAGDCAEFEDATIGGVRRLVGNWTNAVAQGRHVGRALLGEREEFGTLTQYASSVVPGANLIFLGETKMRPGVEREETVIEAGRKILEIHRLRGRAIGAVLLNCPEKRAEAAGLIHFTK